MTRQTRITPSMPMTSAARAWGTMLRMGTELASVPSAKVDQANQRAVLAPSTTSAARWPGGAGRHVAAASTANHTRVKPNDVDTSLELVAFIAGSPCSTLRTGAAKMSCSGLGSPSARRCPG